MKKSIKYKIVFFCIIFLWVHSITLAQTPKYNFTHFSIKEGLSSNSINSILKDKQGFMWFATEDGLNKFDGQNFTIYRHKTKDKNSIGIGSVVGLQVDKNNNLWVSTNYTLSRYNKNSNNFTNYDFKKLGWIRCLLADKSGKIWVGTYSGLHYFDPTTNQIKSYLAQSSNPSKLNSDVILSIFEDHKNRVWVGTNKGLHCFNRETEKFRRYLPNKENHNSISDYIIRSITEDKKGQIWIGTDIGGLNVYDDSNETFRNFKNIPNDPESISSNKVHKVIIDKNNLIWLGTENGLNIFNPISTKSIQIKSSSTISNNSIGEFVGSNVKDIYIDNGGIYWFGTGQSGLNKYDSNLAFFNHINYQSKSSNGLISNSVTCFTEKTNSELLIGTYSGLCIYKPDLNKFARIPLRIRSGNENIVSSLITHNDNTWVGTYQDGIFVLNKLNQIIKHIEIPDLIPSNNNIPINALKTDLNGNIWIGTNGKGIFKFDQQTQKLTEVENKFYKNAYISSIERDQKGNMWVGSNGAGIAIYYSNSNKIKILTQENSQLSVDKVLNIFCSSSGDIWVGVLGGGLCKFIPKTDKFIQFGEKDFLANDVVYKILEDKNHKLWLSTNKGISSFDVKKLKFKNYGFRNGIQQNSFYAGSGLKASNGILYFGGLDGFNYFDPNKLSINTNTPKLVFTDLKINNKSSKSIDNTEQSENINSVSELNLSFKQNFSLDFVALNYTSPEENQYHYKLDGFDKNWIMAGQTNSAVYTNLDPGTYVFRLKANSEDGSWKTPERSIKIIVNPPFYRTYLAYFIYISVLFFILWMSRNRAIKKLKYEFALEQERLQVKHLIETERKESEKKVELEKLKIKFLTNLSHELKTPLSLVINPVENLLLKEKNSEKSEALQLIDRNSKRLLNLVNQLLDLKKIEENEIKLNTIEEDLVKIVKDIIESFKYISERKKIELDFDTNLNTYVCKFDKEKIERILFNLLSNAIKFTNENGNVFIQLEKVYNKGVNLIIRDTGIGLDSESKERIFERFYQSKNNLNILNQGSGIGLSITQEFVKLHGGCIEVESEEGYGTEFKVFLPLLPKKVTWEDITQTAPQENITAPNENLKPVLSIEKPTVLLIDDSEDFRSYLKENFQEKYNVIEANDGKSGWQKTLSGHPDIIISDVNMPNMDGLNLSKKIKNDDRTKHIPIVLLTVNNSETQQLMGLNSGATDYLTKPFSFNILNTKIENLLNLNYQFKKTYSKKINFDFVDPNVKMTENEKFIAKVKKIVEDNIGDPEISIHELSNKMFVSRGTLYNKILQITGEAPVEFIRSLKLNKAAQLLENTDMKISQIAYEVGFSNPNYFARAFKAKFSVSPSEYIKLKNQIS